MNPELGKMFLLLLGLVFVLKVEAKVKTTIFTQVYVSEDDLTVDSVVQTSSEALCALHTSRRPSAKLGCFDARTGQCIMSALDAAPMLNSAGVVNPKQCFKGTTVSIRERLFLSVEANYTAAMADCNNKSGKPFIPETEDEFNLLVQVYTDAGQGKAYYPINDMAEEGTAVTEGRSANEVQAYQTSQLWSDVYPNEEGMDCASVISKFILRWSKCDPSLTFHKK